MSYNGDLEKVRRKAEEQGWRYKRTEGNHHQFFSPDKETIVVTSGTPGDQRGWLNFLSDMRRGGYRDEFPRELSALGQALVEAGVAPEPNQTPTEKATTTQGEVQMLKKRTRVRPHVLSLLKNHKALTMQEIINKISAVEKKSNPRSIEVSVYKLVADGLVRRVAPGVYGALEEGTAQTQPVKAITPNKPEGNVVGALTGDSTIDADLEVLDKALSALADIEHVVQRHRARLFKMAELKKLLGE